ncbi:hypothetical protein CEP54_009478 [Fusarium duplospermum]|uniref:Uncharacterized protein n=1 Tax=Fusarium duplospermum TaxID=1325734 RepID=A0A428PQB3_9HYPO|nr:hypothetical protein CEP54_009478 [Fusarium duplospermum]
MSIPPSCHISSPHTIFVLLLLRIAFRVPGNIANSPEWQTQHSTMSPDKDEIHIIEVFGSNVFFIIVEAGITDIQDGIWSPPAPFSSLFGPIGRLSLSPNSICVFAASVAL